MGMGGGGTSTRWCPTSRLGVQPGVWLYTWTDCTSSATVSKISTASLLPMGCPSLGNPAGSPFCQSSMPLAISTSSDDPSTASSILELTAEPDVITDNDEPLSIYTAGIEDDSLLRDFKVSEDGSTYLIGTNVAELPELNRYVRIYEFGQTPRGKNGKAPAERRFNLATEIDADEWRTDPNKVQVVSEVSRFGYQPNYRLLKDSATGLLIPTLLKPSPEKSVQAK
jgi:hypothetical protein